MRQILAASALCLTMAACSEPAAPPAAEPPAEPVAVTLGGVDLNQPVRLLGTEPFWGVDMTATEFAYSGVDRPEQRAPRPQTNIQGTTVTWTTTTEAGVPLVVTLMETECSDGMSDRTYPLVARVEVGTETLNGCAAQTSAIMSAGESGPVTAPAA